MASVAGYNRPGPDPSHTSEVVPRGPASTPPNTYGDKSAVVVVQ